MNFSRSNALSGIGTTLMFAATFAIGCGGGSTLHEVEAPRAPDDIPPDVKSLPKASSPKVRPVVIDADMPAKVEEIDDLSAAFEGTDTKAGTHAKLATHEICATTPCVTELGYGAHFFRFSALNDAETRHSLGRMLVDDKKIVLRHAVGRYETHGVRRTLGSISQTVGLISLIAGGASIGASAALNTAGIDGTDKVSDPMMTGGIVGVSAGVAFLVGGIVLQAISDDVYQPGTSVQFEARPYLVRSAELAAGSSAAASDAGLPLLPPMSAPSSGDAGSGAPSTPPLPVTPASSLK